MVNNFTLTVGCISRLKTIAGSDETQEKFNVRVLDIYRYIIDKSFPIVDPDFTDAFDIVITDGRYKTKCLLAPTLNFLVYEHKLRKNAIVSLTEYSSLIDEESLEQVPCVILQDIEILNLAPANTPDPEEDIEFCENATAYEKQELPLTVSRGYYLPLWNDEDYFGSKWFNDPDLKLSKPITNAITILDLDSFWKALPRPFPALIGRIVSKTRINHYGKSSDEKRRYPYQFYLELEDRTATVSVCVWNSFCVLLYNYLQVGDIVAVLNYRVARKFAARSNAVYNTSDAVNIEISVNPTNPVAEVYKIVPEEVGPEWRLPGVPYRFIDRKSLSSYSSGLICDIVGTVLFVSREIRERKGTSSSFWTSKWVHLRDGTTTLPIILQLYASSQPEAFDSISAGKVLVCARMLLKIESQDSKHRKFCFLTTTRETQLYVLKQPSDAKNKPFTGSSAIDDAIKWRQSDEAKRLLGRSCSGGYFDFPPLPHSLESYKMTFPQESPMDLTTTVNLGFVLNELHFREHVRLHIQGIIVAMEFVPAESSEGTSYQTAGETSCSQLSESQSSNDKGKASSSTCPTSQSTTANKGTSSEGSSYETAEETNCESQTSDKESRGSSWQCPTCSQSTDKSSAPFTSQERGSSADSSPSNRKKLSSKRKSRVQTRSAKYVEESESDSEDKSTATRREIKTRSIKKYNYVRRRVNPERKCKKVEQSRPKLVLIKTTARRESSPENLPPVRKRKGTKPSGHFPTKAKRKAPKPKAKSSMDAKAEKKGKSSKGGQRAAKTVDGVSEITDSEQASSADSTKPAKYFPFRVLDETWPHIPDDTPRLGLSKPGSHENTFPRLCSQGLTDVRVVPRADRQGFVNSEGYWRLMIAGLNRRAIIYAIFMPQTPQVTEDTGEEPEDGVFLSALATGAFPSWYPVETLLDRASKELSGRKTVFVLDVYSHGEDKVEVVINRAY